jgi:hypothetical protein
MIALFEWVGCLTGLCGSALLALNNKYSGWGFVLYLVSNVAWIAYGIATHANGLIVMQIGFTITGVLGIWNWLVVKNRG